MRALEPLRVTHGLTPGQRILVAAERLSRPGGVRTSDLRRELGVGARSLRRLFASLRELDLVIVESGEGEERRARLTNVVVARRWSS